MAEVDTRQGRDCLCSAGEVMRRLTAEGYAVDAVTAAKALVGAWLCRRLDDGTVVRRRITETEAYCGEEDTACHAHKGRTARTDVMYSPGGCAYIYLCYGMHEMLNVVTGPEGASRGGAHTRCGRRGRPRTVDEASPDRPFAQPRRPRSLQSTVA